MKNGKLYIFSTVLFIVQTCCHLKRKHFGWCGPYDTFCLFSGGIETRVSDLSEAQFKCSEIKNDSWPVELGDERVKEVFIEFIHNYSISNVILNAFNRNGNWYWKKNNISIAANAPIEKENDNVLFYNNSKYHSNYSIVCMTNCKANWSFENHTGYTPGETLKAFHNLDIKSSEECKEFCERNITCSSVDWTYGPTFHGCWVQRYPYDISKRTTNINTSHHVVDRTVKSPEGCVGGDLSVLHQDLREISSEKIPETNLNLVPIVVPILFVFFTFAVTVPIVIFFKRRQIGNHPQQNESQNPDTNMNYYGNEELVEVDPQRHLGPRGDIYTDVNTRDLKQYLDRRNVPQILNT